MGFKANFLHSIQYQIVARLFLCYNPWSKEAQDSDDRLAKGQKLVLSYLEPLRQVGGSDFIVLIREVAAFQLAGLIHLKDAPAAHTFLGGLFGAHSDLTLSLIILILILFLQFFIILIVFLKLIIVEVHTKNLLGFLQGPVGDSKRQLAQILVRGERCSICIDPLLAPKETRKIKRKVN